MSTSGEQVRLLPILRQTEYHLEWQLMAGMETKRIPAEA